MHQWFCHGLVAGDRNFLLLVQSTVPWKSDRSCILPSSITLSMSYCSSNVFFSFVKISYCWDPFLSCMDLASSLDCAWPRFQNKKLAKSAPNNFWGNVSYYLLLLELQLLPLHFSGQKCVLYLVAKPFTSPWTLLQCNNLVLLSSTNLSVGPLALKTETSCRAWLIILVVSATVLISELSIHPFYSQQLQQCMALHKCSQNLGE